MSDKTTKLLEDLIQAAGEERLERHYFDMTTSTSQSAGKWHMEAIENLKVARKELEKSIAADITAGKDSFINSFHSRPNTCSACGFTMGMTGYGEHAPTCPTLQTPR